MAVTRIAVDRVRLDGTAVVFDGFVETDSGVVEVLAAAPDREVCAHELLCLGARLAGLAAGTGGLRELEAKVGARLEALTTSAKESVSAASAGLAEQSRTLFAGEDSEIHRALTAWRTELDRHLGVLFGADDKRSVITAIEKAMTDVLDAYSRRLTAATDPDVPTSTAGRLLSQVQRNAKDLKAELAALTLAVGAQRGQAAENDRTAVNSLEFEPVVFDAVVAVCAPYGDLVEHVGRTSGVKGSKKGDICVTLADDDLPGIPGRYAVEVKARPLTLQATWRELDAVMANREAAAAVAVFSSGRNAPTDLPFYHSGERAIVVLDRDDPDPAALTLACLFARWVVRRRLNPAGTGPDRERVTAALERIQRSLARVATIRRDLATAARATGGAREQLDELAAETRAALAELTAELRA